MRRGLKNAIDWASRPFEENPFRDKPVLVVGASTGIFGAVWAQAELRKVLAHIGADVADSELAIGQAHLTLSDEDWRTSELAARLREQLEDLALRAGAEREPAAAEEPSAAAAAGLPAPSAAITSAAARRPAWIAPSK